jgi:DNA-directed RNA polymerase specialized sigma24 family protein
MKNESRNDTLVHGLQIVTTGRVPPIVYVGLNGAKVVSDEELVDLVSHGNAAAMEPLADRYYASLVAYAFRLSGGDQGMAEDVVQDAFVKILGQRSYRSDRPAKPWIYRIVTNCAHDRFRRSSRMEGGSVIDQDDAEPRPDELALTAELQGRSGRPSRSFHSSSDQCSCSATIRTFRWLKSAQL